MKLWQRRAIGILTLGGSYLGMAMVSPFIFSQESWLAKLLAIFFVLMYCFGIWCGLRLLESSNKSLFPCTIFWLVQIPYFMSPLAGYGFTSGALFYITYEYPAGFSWFTRLGSQFGYSLLQADKPFIIGVNLFALLIAGFLAYKSSKSSN